MKRLSFILLLCAFVSVASAQKITQTFQNVPLSDALKYIQEQTTNYNITFIYDELEDFRVTTHLQNKPIPDAIVQLAGFYPVRVVKSGKHEIYVECTHKTDRHLTGIIIDEQGQPVAYANIALLNPADSTLLSGGVSNESGYFAIPYEQEKTLIRISYVGYKTIYRLCDRENVGTIRMHPDSYKLNGVEVKGQRPLVRMKDDAFVTTVEGSYLAKMGTGNDVLGQIPGVLRNGENIEVIGRGTPLIYINGRQMRNPSELDQLSSDQIKDVDVIMTPGAKYDATVKAVIRIKTIRPVGEGFSFNSRTVAGVNHYVYGLEELNMNYRTGGLDIFGMAEYENRRSRQTNDSRQDTYLQSHYQQSSLMHYYNKNQMLAGKLGFNYMLNDKHSIGMTYTVTSRPNSQTSDYFTTMFIDKQTDDQIKGRGKVDGDDIQHIISGYYAGQTGKWSLDANADVLFQKQNSDSQTFEDATQGDDRTVTTRNDVKNRLYAAKFVAGHPLWKGKLEIGAEGSYVHRTDVFGNVERIIDASDTKIEENSTAAFVQLMQRLNKLTLIAGLRYEYLDSRYYEGGVKMDDESRMVVVDQIFNVFQSTGAFTLKDVRTTNLRELSDAVVYARSLPKEDRNEILQAFTELVRSGERTLYEQLENAGNSIPGFIRKWAAKRGEEIEKKMIAEEAAKDEELSAEPAAAEERIAPEQKAPEQKAPEKQTPEQKAPEQKAPEQKAPEKKTPEQKAPEQKAPEKQTPEQKA